MLSVADIKSIRPTKVCFDLPTRVTRAEEEFFSKTGDWVYQLELCEKLHRKCVDEMVRVSKSGHSEDAIHRRVQEIGELVVRMDILLLKGIQKTEEADRLVIDRC